MLHANFLIAILTLSTTTRAFAQEAQLIAAAQRVSVASLDSTHPDVPFERWLAELARVPRSAIRWEVNDCGEGGDGREAPTCVEAIVDLAADTTANTATVRYSAPRSRPTSAPSMSDRERYGTTSVSAVLTPLNATTSASRRQ